MPGGGGAAPAALTLPRGFCRSVWVMVTSQQPLSVTPVCVCGPNCEKLWTVTVLPLFTGLD